MNQSVLLNSYVDFSNKVEYLLRRLHLNSEPCLQVYVLIRKYGPLVGPSANLSGHASGTKYQAIVSEFDQVVPGIEDDDFLTGQDSTILDISGSKARILRQGSITKADLLAQVPELSFEEDELPQ